MSDCPFGQKTQTPLLARGYDLAIFPLLEFQSYALMPTRSSQIAMHQGLWLLTSIKACDWRYSCRLVVVVPTQVLRWGKRYDRTLLPGAGCSEAMPDGDSLRDLKPFSPYDILEVGQEGLCSCGDFLPCMSFWRSPSWRGHLAWAEGLWIKGLTLLPEARTLRRHPSASAPQRKSVFRYGLGLYALLRRLAGHWSVHGPEPRSRLCREKARWQKCTIVSFSPPRIMASNQYQGM